jgi:hypothetical protein
MELTKFSRMMNPVYVLVGGVFGGAIPFFMYLWNFPISKEYDAQRFVQAQYFLTWLFLLSSLFSCSTIVFLPGWKVFSQLYSDVIKESKVNIRWKVIGLLTVSILMFLCALFFFNALSLRFVNFPVQDNSFAEELRFRFWIVYLYAALGFVPVMFCIILINNAALAMSEKITLVINDEEATLKFIKKYLYHRNVLQICLVTTGGLLSLNPIITAAFFSVWKEIKVFTPDNFPSHVVIIYGLIFTLLLLFIYVPTYINLTNVGRDLCNAKYPYPQHLDDLKNVMEKRKTLDELLQTNIGIAENLKNGIFTLSPLISGLIAGLLGIK